MAPDSNSQSKWKPRVHDRRHNLQSPVQNENAKPLVQKNYYEFPDNDSRALNQAGGPSEHGSYMTAEVAGL